MTLRMKWYKDEPVVGAELKVKFDDGQIPGQLTFDDLEDDDNGPA